MLGAYAVALTKSKADSVDHWKGKISPAFTQKDCFSTPQRRTRPRRKAVCKI